MNNNNKQSIIKAIFHNILEHELFGMKNVWQDYMQREVLNLLPREYNEMFEEVVGLLINDGILEITEKPHLRVTTKGQDFIFLNDNYTADKLENTIITHLREDNYYAESIWHRFTHMAYCEKKLNAYQKYIFPKTIDKMIDEGIFICDSEYNLKLTQLGQDKIYGKIDWIIKEKMINEQTI